MRSIGPAEMFHGGSVDGVQNAVNDVPGQAVSGASVYRGVKTDMRHLPDASLHFTWSGTPTGTIIVQVSNHPNPSDLNDTNWLTLTLAAPITQPAGSASGDYCDLAALPFRWARPKYTNAGGSGSLFAWFEGKGA